MSLNSLSTLYATFNELTSYFKSPPAGLNTDAASGPWRPPQWNNLPSDQQQLFMMKTSIASSLTVYFFDAVMRVEHASEMKITEHPVQTGANISDHAYQMPAKLVMEIGMSDAMDTLGPNSWTGAYTKSVSAYRTLVSLMQNRIPLKIHTRLINYENMLIESIHAPDDYKIQFGGRFTVNFKQIITAQIFTTTESSRPNASTQTNSGTVNPSAAPTGSVLSSATGGN
jgi:hypothetical protein